MFRVAAWLVAAALVLAGIAALAYPTGQLKALAVPTAVGCFIAAALQWLALKAVAEAIALFVDIAYDVRAIVVRINSSDSR
ncbi:MAG: hypothetical protein WB579_06935 [Bryobacteraceae bacterium]